LIEEHQYWKNLRKGDHESLRLIYNDEFDYLYNYCKRLTTDDQLIEDSIHDMFVYLWEKREGLSPIDQIRPYLTVSLRRRIIKNLQNLSVTDNADNLSNTGTDTNIQSEIIHSELYEEKQKNIQAALQYLSSRQREILHLKYEMDYDYERICEIMNINYQSARNLCNSALSKLRKSLGMIILLTILMF